MPKPVSKPKVVLTEAQIEAQKIRKSLHHVAIAPPRDYWLDTKCPALNRVFGSEKLGLAYGMIYNIWGPPSQGKSLTTLDLAAMAQADGAHLAWMPLEGPFDETWAFRRGIDTSRLVLIEPRVIQSGKSKPRMTTIQELCDEAELLMENNFKKNNACKQFLAIDTVAAMLTAVEYEAGVVDQNMNTVQAHPKFIGQLLRRWSGLAQAYNAMIFLVNQIRMKPGVMFGSPEYQPGGNALLHYSASIVFMHRMGGGEIKDGENRVGYRAILRNDKNKVGHGSVERRRAGMIYKFGYKTKYCEADILKRQRAAEMRGDV